MKPHRVVKEYSEPFRAFWRGEEVSVTHAIMTWDGKQRSQVILPDGTTKLVSHNRLKMSIVDLFKDLDESF